MQRRALLSALGASAAAAATAGCIGATGGPGGDDTTTSDDDTSNQGTTTENGTTDDAATRMDVSNVALDSLPDDVDASVDVTATQDVTESHPAVFEIAVTNTADGERTWEFGAVVPWSSLYGEQGDGKRTVLLAPGGEENDVVPDAPQEDACWRATDGIATIQVVKEKTFAPGETKSATYAFLAGPESDCLGPGTYRFEDNNFLGETKWGFEVTLATTGESGT